MSFSGNTKLFAVFLFIPTQNSEDRRYKTQARIQEYGHLI